MIKRDMELEQLRISIEENFRILGNKISQNDQRIKRVLEKIEQDSIKYNHTYDMNDIKIVSYLDN